VNDGTLKIDKPVETVTEFPNKNQSIMRT